MNWVRRVNSLLDMPAASPSRRICKARLWLDSTWFSETRALASRIVSSAQWRESAIPQCASWSSICGVTASRDTARMRANLVAFSSMRAKIDEKPVPLDKRSFVNNSWSSKRNASRACAVIGTTRGSTSTSSIAPTSVRLPFNWPPPWWISSSRSMRSCGGSIVPKSSLLLGKSSSLSRIRKRANEPSATFDACSACQKCKGVVVP